jgi:hypothetical protein
LTCFATPVIFEWGHFPNTFHIIHSDIRVNWHIQTVVESGFPISIATRVKDPNLHPAIAAAPGVRNDAANVKNLMLGITILAYNRLRDRLMFRRLCLMDRV